ncbi:uncharacterized protein LOC124940474 [Impatiens glandulifera]|uniref:uncharacterized protein LOC124940474 n=1 Tax=Impatiens glandulifera TaxID=253017 RepID=UPI001FB14296|nr:uncharacterized protein LOC124940474 [Impatiens glandulifera]XP_047336954.1 uncharacterized protein LOC124940474 [Impatiens glandulifera]
MEVRNGAEEIDYLEKGLLSRAPEDEDESVLYRASFEESQENFVKYQTARWILCSLLLVLAWGIGLFMLLYIPVRRYILRKDILSRKLHLTHDAIVYKVVRPVTFPCFGVLKKEKHVLLHSVADIVIEQGYMQSLFGVYSVRIENIGIRRPPSDDVQIQGVANPNAFKRAVLTRLSNMRNEAFSRQVSMIEDAPNSLMSYPSAAYISPSPRSFQHLGDHIILQKLEEVSSSVKRVRSLVEERHPKTSEPID